MRVTNLDLESSIRASRRQSAAEPPPNAAADDGTQGRYPAEPNVAATYVAGEDASRLQSAARELGLSSARPALRPVREAVDALMHDSTLEAATMHSVGALATDERVDGGGTIHLMTLTRRKRGQAAAAAAAAAAAGSRPEYGKLMDVFQKEPLELEAEEGEEFEVVEGGSLTAAVFGIIKGTVGPAILYLPRGFHLSGYAVAIPSLIVATASYIYSAHRLLQCWRAEREKMARIEEVRALLEDPNEPPAKEGGANYGSLDEERRQNAYMHSASGTLLSYPELSRRAFGKFSCVIMIGIALMEFGVCLTYLIYVPQNLVECTRSLFGMYVSKTWFLIPMVAIEIPLAWIIDIRKLTPTNILATFLIAYGLASCLAIALFQSGGHLIENISNLPAWNETWYLFIGTSFFVFEGGITLLVPLQEAVFREEDKKKFPSVNQRVISSIVVFYIIFAITCWAAFGDGVKTALTASLPEGAFSTSVQFAYSIAVIFTFPLIAFPALEVTLHATENRGRAAIVKRNILASLIICCLGVVAFLAIDYLGNVVSLLGSLVGIPIALIYPPLMHNRLVKGISQSTRALNYSVSGLGLFAMGAASYSTIVSWDKGAES